MIRRWYGLVLTMVIPLALLRLWWRGRHNPAYRQRIAERLGWYSPPHPCALWVHAVSVGETVAAVPLILELLNIHPELQVMVTNTTPTGAERVRSLLGDRVVQAYLPWDRARPLRRWIQRLQPKVLVIMETELWPNLLAEAQQQGVQILLTNARLSERSAKGYGRWPALVQPMLQCLTAIAAQDEATATRFQQLGVDASRIVVTGSLKFDAQRPSLDRQQLKQERVPGRYPVLTAGSTHSGEDVLILQAFAQVQALYPQALLIVVPRHQERFVEVGRLIQSLGWTMQRRSDATDLNPATAVWLADSMGEMMTWYALADIALVAGSLLPELGGHNMLEPMVLEVPTLSGPYVLNFQVIADTLVQAGALGITSAEHLAEAWLRIVQQPEQSARMIQAAHQVLQSNRGALQRQLALIERCISAYDAAQADQDGASE